MILIIPILAYILLIVGLILISNRILKNKEAERRKRNRKRIIITSLILLPIYGFICFLLFLRIGFNDHYDVKKGTFLWYITMNNKAIKEFPLIEPIGNVTYNSKGNDYKPNIVSGWEVEYETKKSSAELIPLLKKYFLKKGYKLKEVSKPECSWRNYHKNDSTLLFAGVSKKGECLDLTIKILVNGNSNIEALILD